MFCRCGRRQPTEADGRRGVPAAVQCDRYGQQPLPPPAACTLPRPAHAHGDPLHLSWLRNACYVYTKPHPLHHPASCFTTSPAAAAGGHAISSIHHLLHSHCPLPFVQHQTSLFPLPFLLLLPLHRCHSLHDADCHLSTALTQSPAETTFP